MAGMVAPGIDSAVNLPRVSKLGAINCEIIALWKAAVEKLFRLRLREENRIM